MCRTSPAGSAEADPVLSLIAAWLREATSLRERYADFRLASLAEAHARELREAVEQRNGSELTLQQAAAESGYSTAHLRHLIASGELLNVGRRGRPRVRRGALPTKPYRKRQGHDRAQAPQEIDVSPFIADAARRRRP